MFTKPKSSHLQIKNLLFNFESSTGTGKGQDCPGGPPWQTTVATRACFRTSLTEGPDAKIDWKVEGVRAEARLDGGNAAEMVLTRNHGATGEGTTIIKNMPYFAATRNDGFNILPVEFLAYRHGPRPAPFEFRGTSGWTITIDMNAKDVVAAR